MPNLRLGLRFDIANPERLCCTWSVSVKLGTSISSTTSLLGIRRGRRRCTPPQLGSSTKQASDPSTAALLGASPRAFAMFGDTVCGQCKAAD